MESVESNKINFIHLLLKHGADPHIRNNDGETAMSVSPPFIQEILGSEVKQRMLKERRLLKEAAGGSLRSCIACGGQKDGNKRMHRMLPGHVLQQIMSSETLERTQPQLQSKPPR